MIGSQLQQELMGIIMHELDDPRLEKAFISITRVDVLTDLSAADVFVTIMGTPGKQTAALNALKHSAGMMRARLMKTLPMRTIPFLKFQIDEQLKRELTVLELIAKAKAEYQSPDGDAPFGDARFEEPAVNEDAAAHVAAERSEVAPEQNAVNIVELDGAAADPDQSHQPQGQ